MTFEAAAARGITDQKLTQSYPGRLELPYENRKAKKAFDRHQVAEWLRFWQGFDQQYAPASGLRFKVFHKFYFGTDGAIHYFLYRIDGPAGFSREINTYEQHLEEYLREFRFQLPPVSTPWSQCGSWGYK